MTGPGPEYWFYHLERARLEEALPPLIEKTLARGWRALIRGSDPARIEALDDLLWTYRDDAFLPHGRADLPDAARQPALLTTGAANLNGAAVVFLVDGADPPDLERVERVVILFDGADAVSIGEARARWKAVKAQGARAAYWRQSPEGRWEKAE